MPFPPPRNHRISLNDARIMTRRWREQAPANAIRAFCFPKSCYDEIFAQAGCVGIRSHLCAHADGTTNLILIGVDADMNDILHAPAGSSPASTDGNGEGGGDNGDAVIMQDSFPCPIYCGGDGAALGDN